MRHLFTATVTAIEAVAVALVSLVLIAACALLMWLLPFSMQSDPQLILRAVASIWGLAHGVGIEIIMGEQMLNQVGAPKDLTFVISLIPLGISAITVWLAILIGARATRGVLRGASMLLGATIGFGAAAYMILWLAKGLSELPDVSSVTIAILWFALPAWTTYVSVNFYELLELSRIRGIYRIAMLYLPRILKVCVVAGLSLVMLASIGVLLTLITSYPEVMRLNQTLQLDLVGTIILFILQLAYLPVLVIWALAWMSGLGFQIGTSSLVGPLETLLGPLPAIPVLGAIPSSWGQWGFIAVILTVLVLFAAGWALASLPELREPKTLTTVIVSVVASCLIGLIAALLAVLASGGIGPGRMEEAGVHAWQFGLIIAIEAAVGITAGLLAKRAIGEKQKTTVISGISNIDASDLETVDLSRIADPEEQREKPWFRKRSKSEIVSPPVTANIKLTEEELIQEYSWETIKQTSESETDDGVS